jgi:NitT/TauT family transport system substrate-binding protein
MTTPVKSRRGLLQGLLALSASRLAPSAGLGLAAGPGCGRRKSGSDAFAVGYLNNITHAQALVGVARGAWGQALGQSTRLIAFPAGPAVMEALSAGSIDAGFLGPTAIINAFVRSKGTRLRILSGSASGGASLVARKALSIRGASGLAGRTVTASLIGSTPDVSLRAYLTANGLRPLDRGGDVRVIPMANAEAFALLKRGQLDAAWAQEPWASRMVERAGCERVLDERELWAGGRFPTTILAASTRGLEAFPRQIATLVGLLGDETRRMEQDGERARGEVGDALAVALGARLSDGVLRDAWGRFAVTTEAMPAALDKVAADMRAIGYLPQGSLDGLMARGTSTSEGEAG